ncbi:MAG TPA: oligosaccharide flippase family protein [Pseudacidobacterium sp.]|nr:oligosaccharide flippase family protein [Pseudacidobacterium sp.]
MNRHLTNAAFGVLDYAAYPLGMFLVAPIVLHKLGASEYGMWAIATAVISIGGIIASGFSDANIQRVARLRGSGEIGVITNTVRSMLGINLVLGFVLALAAWLAAPYAAQRISLHHVEQTWECFISLRIASVLILVRAVESVPVSTQRAFEEYRGTVQINVAVRLFTLASAALLALSGRRTVSILLATAVFLVLGTILQFHELRRFLGDVPIKPKYQREETRVLLRFGVFSWLQALGGVIFAQLDRVLLGLSLGAATVAPYVLCVQFSQPLFGLTASGLQFLFPHFSKRVVTADSASLTKTLLKAFACNLFLVLCGAGLLLLLGDRLIQAWAGVAVAQKAATILPLVVMGASLMGLSVTGTYALLAFGMFRTLAIFNLSNKALMLFLMTYLLRHHGLQGLAFARVCYGFLALLPYAPLLRKLSHGMKESHAGSSIVMPRELSGEPEL